MAAEPRICDCGAKLMRVHRSGLDRVLGRRRYRCRRRCGKELTRRSPPRSTKPTQVASKRWVWPLLIVVAILAVWISLQLSQTPPVVESKADVRSFASGLGV